MACVKDALSAPEKKSILEDMERIWAVGYNSRCLKQCGHSGVGGEMIGWIRSEISTGYGDAQGSAARQRRDSHLKAFGKRGLGGKGYGVKGAS